jgi:transcriptional regulator with XRE-family HTH domain
MRFSGIKLRALREERSLTLQDVAEELGVTSMTVSRYENGQREPRLSKIEHIASCFDVPLSYLLEADNASMDEIYRTNFEKELAREFANNIANRLVSHMTGQGLSLEAGNELYAILLHDLWDLADRDLHTMTNVEEVRGVMTHLRQMAKIVDECIFEATGFKSVGEEAVCRSKTTPKASSKRLSKPRSSVLRDTSAPAAIR